MVAEITTIEVGELAVDMRRAHELLGFGSESRWLAEPGCPVPYCDLRKPGATKPVLRWRVRDLESFLEMRLVQPGQSNPQAV